jgi:hypothetical protein
MVNGPEPVLIGGYAKCFPEPFSGSTHSGKLLRKMVSDVGLGDVIFFDLWESERQERVGYVFTETRRRLLEYQKEGRQLVALGLRVFNALAVCEELREVIYFPHPASRRPEDLRRLKKGLERLKRIQDGGMTSRATTVRIPNGIESDAVFSEDRKFRYALSRKWSDGPMMLFVGLNPSVADERVDDRTQVRCRNSAKSYGYGGYFMANLFAYISTNARALEEVGDPIGPDNDSHIRAMLHNSTMTVAAWGCRDRRTHERAKEVARLLREARPIYALETTKDGCPHHPLYLKNDVQLVEWRGGL